MSAILCQGSSRRNQLKGKEEFRSSIIDVHTLPDEVLMEILVRLGSSKDAIRCKAVSKRWNCIVSDPLFKSCFVKYCCQKNQQLPFDFVKTCLWQCKRDVLQPSRLSLRFLEGAESFSIINSWLHLMGTCNDLVLIGSSWFPSEFTICNPQTKQWRGIPPSPLPFLSLCRLLDGFICNFSNYQDFSSDGQFRYRIVLIALKPPKYQNVAIFLSETGRWREATLAFPDGLDSDFANDMDTRGIPLNGMLHWVSVSERYMIRMNPFISESDVIRCGIISLRGLARYWINYPKWQLGYFQGRLRLGLLTEPGTRTPRILRVFELEDERSANGVHFWCCKYELSLNSCVADNSYIVDNLDHILTVFCFHPDNEA